MVNLCPEYGEPLNDFSQCACALGLTRNRPVDLKPKAFTLPFGYRVKVEDAR